MVSMKETHHREALPQASPKKSPVAWTGPEWIRRTQGDNLSVVQPAGWWSPGPAGRDQRLALPAAVLAAETACDWTALKLASATSEACLTAFWTDSNALLAA